MGNLIRYDEIPRWVPGKVLQCSDGLGWNGVALRGYRYNELDVAVPGLAEFMIVSYRRGTTRMERRFEGRWTKTQCQPGDISLLTRSQFSHWHWTQDIEVAHTYLSDELLSRVAEDVYQRPVNGVRLQDLLQGQDPTITGLIDALGREADGAGIGGRLYADALGTQLAVHLLRRYADVGFREQSVHGGLAPAVCRRLTDYIDGSLEQPLSLEVLAGVAGLGTWNFGKRFRASFRQTPHRYVMERRLARAQKLLAQERLPVKAVAAACGFADQAHLTRVMRSSLGTTPAALRRQGGE